MKDDPDFSELSIIYKALGDETRLRILSLLSFGELCVCDIMEVLSLPQSTASRHLAYLKNSKWISGRRNGKWMYYTLNLQSPYKPVQKEILTHLNTVKSVEIYLEKLQKYMKTKKKSTCL